MEDSPEHSHWASPSLLSSDALAGFSSEPGLLPAGEESEAFFSTHDPDLGALPSFFPSPNHGRVPSAYRPSSGGCSALIDQQSESGQCGTPPPSALLQPVRSSAPPAASATSSCWTGQEAPPWARTPRRPPPGAAAPSPSLPCTHTPLAASTLPPSQPPERDTAPPAERAGTAPSSRTA